MPRADDRIQRALNQIDEWIQPNGVDAVAAAVVRGGDVVAAHYAGEQSPGVAVGPSTLFGLASVTKPVTAAGVLAAMDAGFLDLDEPIVRLMPEFGDAYPDDARRTMITVRDCLSHQAGLAEDGHVGDGRAGLPTLDELIDDYVQLPLANDPRTLVRYSNTGYAILPRLVERAVGQPFWDWTRQAVFSGDAEGFVVRPTAAQADRIVHLRDAAGAGTDRESYNSDWWRRIAIPWGGAYGTPVELARFAGAFLSPTSATIRLSAAARRTMVAPQTGLLPGGVGTGRIWWPVASWGAGWEIKGDKRRHWSGELTSPRTFCHFGQAGTLVWADPDADIALAVFTNRTVARMWGFILTRWLRLGNAVIAAATTA